MGVVREEDRADHAGQEARLQLPRSRPVEDLGGDARLAEQARLADCGLLDLRQRTLEALELPLEFGRAAFVPDPSDFDVELDPQGAGGAAPLLFIGVFDKTNSDNDTWKGEVTVPADATGNSDSDQSNPSKDAVIRVRARDLKDRNDVQRGLDENGDGTSEVDARDENHRIKLDASTPVTTIQIRKSL